VSTIGVSTHVKTKINFIPNTGQLLHVESKYEVHGDSEPLLVRGVDPLRNIPPRKESNAVRPEDLEATLSVRPYQSIFLENGLQKLSITPTPTTNASKSQITQNSNLTCF
jgi:hypothetical protein